jgi:hypothetical protein
MYPKAVAMQAEIDAAVQDIASTASNPRRLHDVASNVVERMSERLDFPSLGVFSYYNFRSLAEQKELREEAWA